MRDFQFPRDTGVAIATLLPIGVGAVLVPLRDELVGTNLALILVVFVVLGGAIGGRLGGALAAVTAALSFNFFLTQPYLSLDIESADDVETTLLLLIVGLIVGQLTVRSAVHRADARRARSEIHQLTRIADLVARGEDPADVLLAAQQELTDLLGLERCRFEAAPTGTSFARLESSGAVSGKREWRMAGRDFVLPAEGVELPVSSHGRSVGRFLMFPRPGIGVSREARVVAVAIADEVGAALAQSGAKRG